MLPLGALELTITLLWQYGRLRGETMMPGQRTRPEVQRQLSDERRQYDSERKRLVCQQQNDSLRSLMARERDRQSTARHREDHDIVSVQTSSTNFPCVLCSA